MGYFSRKLFVNFGLLDDDVILPIVNITEVDAP